MAPGLWLAPFILHPNAQLVKEHPDWLLRDHKNQPVTAGFGWNKLVTYALDLTQPDALS
jgi:alpha-galactosidase